MADIPGMKCDVYFGDTTKPLPNWRDHAEDDSEDDEPSEDDRAAVKAMLRIDPRELFGDSEEG